MTNNLILVARFRGRRRTDALDAGSGAASGSLDGSVTAFSVTAPSNPPVALGASVIACSDRHPPGFTSTRCPSDRPETTSVWSAPDEPGLERHDPLPTIRVHDNHGIRVALPAYGRVGNAQHVTPLGSDDRCTGGLAVPQPGVGVHRGSSSRSS